MKVYVIEDCTMEGAACPRMVCSVVAVKRDTEDVKEFVKAWEKKYPESTCNVTEHELT